VGLSRNQKRAIQALMATPSVAAAARRCGLTDRTLWNYLGDPEFKAALDARMDKETTALSASLAGLSKDAMEGLHELVNDREIPPSVRLRAILGWLQQRRDVIELDQLVKRMDALEEKVK